MDESSVKFMYIKLILDKYMRVRISVPSLHNYDYLNIDNNEFSANIRVFPSFACETDIKNVI